MVWAAFIFGLLGSFHCIGMCGPIAFLLPIDRQSNTKGLLQLLSYHLGRILTYALIGTAFGFLGGRLQLFGFQQTFSVLIGAIMVISIVIPRVFSVVTPLGKQLYMLVAKIKGALGVQLKRKTFDMFFSVGFFNGLLPCGLVYLAVFGSMTMESALQGALYMTVFGLGTIPMMSLSVYAGSFLKGRWRHYVTRAIPYAVVIIGLLFILRGMGLDIKYLSPHSMVGHPEVTGKHECH